MDPRKLVIVVWSTVCNPIFERGLGLRSLRDINNSSMLKLGWESVSSSQQWACLFHARVLKNNIPSLRFSGSLIWAGIKTQFATIKYNIA